MATTWTVVTDLADSEEDEWTTVLGATTLNAQAKAWTVKPAVLSPNAQVANSFLGWDNFAPEEFAVIPELVTTDPEETQADRNDWTILADPV